MLNALISRGNAALLAAVIGFAATAEAQMPEDTPGTAEHEARAFAEALEDDDVAITDMRHAKAYEVTPVNPPSAGSCPAGTRGPAAGDCRPFHRWGR